MGRNGNDEAKGGYRVMLMGVSRRYMADPDVVCRREAGQTILFNPDSSAGQGINAVGYLIWQALARPCAPAEIVAHLLATCDGVPVEQVGDDVDEFLRALRPGGFVGLVLDGDEPSCDAPPADPRPPQSALAPALDDEERASFYHGGSMLGTFRPGDRLLSEPLPLAAIRPGDVVIYRGREEKVEAERIVHRVVALTPAGLVTRGDNNPTPDTEPLTAETLLGRVTHLERGGRRRRVPGGRRGLLRARTLHTWRLGRRLGWGLLRSVGRGAYGRLREGHLLRRLWQPEVIRLRLEREDGPLVKYIHRGRTVAWWWPARDRFRLRRPYDLVIPRPGREQPTP